MAGVSPTQNSLKHLRKAGYTAEVVEKFVKSPMGGFRKDLFGFIDILGIREKETLAVQTTSAGEATRRLKKIQESEHLSAVLRAGWVIEVHGWEKVGNRWKLTKHFQLAKEVAKDDSRSSGYDKEG